MQPLEAASAAFGEESSPEKEAIEGFLVKTRAQAKVRPVEEQLKSCEEYLDRSLKKLEETQEEVERTRARLSRLKEEAASLKLLPRDTTPDLEAEVTRLRAELAKMKGGERRQVRSRVAEPRRVQEATPQTEQELWDWMCCKQQKLRSRVGGSHNVVLELTSQLGEAGERMLKVQGSGTDVFMQNRS